MDVDEIAGRLSDCVTRLEGIAQRTARAHEITQEARWLIDRANGQRAGREQEISAAQERTQLAVLNGGAMIEPILEAAENAYEICARL